jgi:hypothetical protein
MSKLGLALIGGSAALNEFERLEDRDTARQRAQKRFDWESQRADSEMSTLPDKTAADRSGYQLRGKQNNANIGLVDAQTENAAKELKLQGAGLDAAQKRQPDEIAAQANKAAVAKTLSEFDVENLPRVIAEKKLQGTFSDADVYTTSVSKLADLLATNDQNAVIRFMNGMNDAGVFGKQHAPVASVTIKQDPTTKENVFVATDAAGQPVMQMGAGQMKRIRDSVGKTEYKTVNAGDSLVAMKGGQVTPVYTAPESAKSAAAKQGPLERDVGYLVNQHGMSKDQALAHLNSAKTMTREQFVLNALKEKAASSYGYKPSQKDADDFGNLYDSVRRGGATGQPGTPAAQPKAGGATGNWQEWVQ